MTISLALVRRLAFASLLANIGIVLTGGAVRLTGSGLGCPTWPRCTDASWTATTEMGLHGAVEFGNRLAGFVVGAIALAVLVAAWRLRPRHRSLRWLAAAVLAGVAVQGAIGGLSVRTELNPWVVSGHFLISMVIIAVAHTLWRGAHEPAERPPERPAERPAAPLRALAWLTLAVTAALLAAGTVVTGSGPHAGDADVARNALDPETVSQAHSQLAFLLLGLAAAGWFGLRAAGAPRAARAAAALVAVILAQGAVGVVQYYTGLPELLVWLHMLGSCLVWLAALELRYAADAGSPRPRHQPASPAHDLRAVQPVGT